MAIIESTFTLNTDKVSEKLDELNEKAKELEKRMEHAIQLQEQMLKTSNPCTSPQNH